MKGSGIRVGFGQEGHDEAWKQGRDEAWKDRELAARAVAGDPEAFEEIVERYYRAIYNLAFRATYNHEDARDLTQDIFLEAYRAIQGFRQDSRISTWLYRIAANKAVDWWRRQYRRHGTSIPISPAREVPEQDESGECNKALDPPSNESGPEEIAIGREQAERVWRVVGSLPDTYRVVIVLYHYEGLSYREISDILRLPVRTVETRLYRAKKMLRGMLSRDDGI
ncbi:MAG TPA: RNA polymerase sigma factor [Firmicutes bacterium]|nr:RNA polymerase sigma factor [Bacillota bacterium]